ncbi:ImmA/IrrE family metallo-endopeptidase [Gluconacetobacter sp.]|uniref:ImmA/IrrE family metallo-endopeptidase n=1 Tax=Gluconacetobacter sp. TaxID=1935994 RepID=UPI0039E91B77
MRSIIEENNESVLRFVFGDNSNGKTAEERARSSDRKFVRSQAQITVATPRATGRVLTASEALNVFGFEVLFQICSNGSFPLLSTSVEPAKTLRDRREQFNLPIERLAKAVGISSDRLETIESPGHVSPVRDLERVAQALALDERILGYQPEARGDKALGVRLRELSDTKDSTHFSISSVIGLSEAAWVIERQLALSEQLGYEVFSRSEFGFNPDSNYAYPTYRQGYRLAQRARQVLELGDDTPVESLRALVEERLGLPLIQQELEERFAGATLSNGNCRGIVINEKGKNQNVWVRRMTLCHELGHLLWDPDQRLNKLIVDDYNIVEGIGVTQRDVVEIRANAFAISFLAPPSAIKEIAFRQVDHETILSDIVETYGISATAAKWHAGNVSGIDFSSVPTRNLPSPSDDWIARENLTVDYFPIQSTPISRRGQFALLVVKALRSNLISNDTASMYLRCSKEESEQSSEVILNLLQ